MYDADWGNQHDKAPLMIVTRSEHEIKGQLTCEFNQSVIASLCDNQDSLNIGMYAGPS